ncbi:MAG TPA: cytidine deaminase [Rubricoccaceae bacterium]
MSDPDALRAHAVAAARLSVAPFSGRPAGAAVRLQDGRWAAAPRVENSAFPTTIPALAGAVAVGLVAGGAPVAAAHSQPLTASDLAFLADATGRPWRLVAPDVAVADGAEAPADAGPVSLRVDAPADDAAGLVAAVEAARSAVVPASAFPVGAVAVDAAGRAVRGANVEYEADWTRGLCAERVALVAACAAGLGPAVRIWVACTKAPGGSPCGACRQVLSDLAPDAAVVLWNGDSAPVETTVAALLPGAFRGEGIGPTA